MPRATWTGSVAFGLVNVPVELYAATEDRTVRFRELEAGTGERIRHRRVAERSGREVAPEDIVKAYEVTRGEYVQLEPGELDGVAPQRSHTIEIEDFVELAEIDPRYFRRSYYLKPAKGGPRPYWLLHRVMRDAGRVAIGRFVLRTKEYLVAVRAIEEGLLVETMFFADEVRDPAALDLGEPSEPAERELRTARRLLDSLTTSWDPDAYPDTYRARVLELIERKAHGEAVVTEPEREPAPVTDLMEALEASLGDASRRPARGTSSHPQPDPDLEELTREELYRRATDADIEGRSKMTKAQLVRALRKQALRRVS